MEAADRHLLEVGFEAFSMAKLAKRLGLAKGTLYLYFQTREEVFLSLTEIKMNTWADIFANAVHPDITDIEFSETLMTTAYADTMLLPMLLRLNTVIEHNVSIDALIASKRGLRNRLRQLAADVARALNLSTEQGLEVLNALAPLLIGAAQTDQGPSLEAEQLPADVREFIDSFDARQVFIPNACRIIRAIRAGE